MRGNDTGAGIVAEAKIRRNEAGSISLRDMLFNRNDVFLAA
jgi:hypothetical protein